MSDLDPRLQPESCACWAQIPPVLCSLELSRWAAGLFLFVTTCLNAASATDVESISDWGARWHAPVLWLGFSCPSEMPRVVPNSDINAGLTFAMFDSEDAPTADPSPSISGITPNSSAPVSFVSNVLAPLFVVLWLPAVRRRSVFLGTLRW